MSFILIYSVLDNVLLECANSQFLYLNPFQLIYGNYKIVILLISLKKKKRQIFYVHKQDEKEAIEHLKLRMRIFCKHSALLADHLDSWKNMSEIG